MDSDVDWQARTVLLPQTKGEPRLLVWRRPSMRRCCRSRVATPSRACKRAGVPPITSHKIGRHSFVARLLAQGLSLKAVQQAGGWSEDSIATLAKHYGHLEQSALDAAVRSSDTNLAQLLNDAQETSEKRGRKRA